MTLQSLSVSRHFTFCFALSPTVEIQHSPLEPTIAHRQGYTNIFEEYLVCRQHSLCCCLHISSLIHQRMYTGRLKPRKGNKLGSGEIRNMLNLWLGTRCQRQVRPTLPNTKQALQLDACMNCNKLKACMHLSTNHYDMCLYDHNACSEACMHHKHIGKQHNHIGKHCKHKSRYM